ncbi:hypothetical protein [Dysgonomonas termitidis]|uniref:Lipoprotein n=1 Tax=Dysgonomonas termitidis TaxID=1516126 RepID=A0ABV9KTW6_9BACT
MEVRNIVKVLPVCGLALLTGLSACSSSKKNVQGEENTVAIADTMKLNLDYTSVDSMTIIYTDKDELKIQIGDTDRGRVGEMLSQLVNDTAWNNSGIMVKMVAPDYMITMHYKGKTQDHNSWISVWKELGKAKFENKWYLLPEEKEQMFELLDSLKQ